MSAHEEIKMPVPKEEYDALRAAKARCKEFEEELFPKQVRNTIWLKRIETIITFLGVLATLSVVMTGLYPILKQKNHLREFKKELATRDSNRSTEIEAYDHLCVQLLRLSRNPNDAEYYRSAAAAFSKCNMDEEAIHCIKQAERLEQ